MKALNSLAVYLGRKELFIRFKEALGLKWSNGDGLRVLNSILEESVNFNNISEWFEEVKGLGWEYYFPVIYTFLTGLRASEGFHSLSILAERGREGYYNTEIKALEHFRFKEIFLRGSKNAFISFISERLLNEGERLGKPVSYLKFLRAVKRRKLGSKLQLCRKAYATILRDHGIPSEIIDLIQGRIPPTVFARNYYRSNLKTWGKKILKLIEPFEKRFIV